MVISRSSLPVTIVNETHPKMQPDHSYNEWRRQSVHYSKNNQNSYFQLPVQDNYEVIYVDDEKKIFDFLLDVCTKYELSTTLRVAGGWVRNKLLRVECADIDIAIDNMSAAQFASYIIKYKDEMGIDNVKTAGIITARPQQSKHQEIATMHIFGQDIDFVCLRPSNPNEIGTPLQDAQFRESTINSLFYNINENIIEDHTGRGISDFQNGILRTPLDATVTFLDDPNRVTRLARFASYFNLLIDDASFIAAREKHVQQALDQRISKERFGIEIVKLMKGPDPSGGLAILDEFQVIHIVFRAKSGNQPFTETPLHWSEESWLNGLYRVRALFHKSNEMKIATKERLTLMFAAILSCADQFIDVVDQKNMEILCTEILYNYLKISNRIALDVAAVIYGARIANEWLSHDGQSVEQYVDFIQNNRLAVGTWLRVVVKEKYVLAALLANFYDTQGTENDSKEDDRLYGANSTRSNAFMEAMQKVDDGTFVQDSIEMKTLLNGLEIAEQLRAKGKTVAAVFIAGMINWQLSIPKVERTKERAVQWAEDNKSQFIAPNK